jgi:cobalt-precorrin 5A hydrolase
MIVAGLGFRRGVTAEEIEAVVALALIQYATTLPPLVETSAKQPPHPECFAFRPLPRGERADPCGGQTLLHNGPFLPSPLAGEGGEAQPSRVRGLLQRSPMGEGTGGSRLLHSSDVTEPGRKIELAALATLAEKAGEPGLVEAARRLALPIIPCSREAMRQVADRIVTFSARAQAAVGLPSVAEAAALVAAGASSRLLLPRAATAAATCAIAEGDAP